MTDKKIREVIALYRAEFKRRAIPKEDQGHHTYLLTAQISLAHCHGMLSQMESFLSKGRRDKAFRWLGFIQGCLWSNGVYTLNELKNHNRP